MTHLNYHMPIKRINLDPHEYNDLYSMIIINQVHRGLFKYNSDGSIQNDLVDSWKSDNNLDFVFTLKDAYFSNQIKITSKHVLNSFLRIFKKQAAILEDLEIIKGINNLNNDFSNLEVLGIKIIDENSFSISLLNPSPVFFKVLAVPDTSILPISDINDLELKDIYSGPYKVVNFTENQIEIEKFTDTVNKQKNAPKNISFLLFDSLTEEQAIKLAKEKKTDVLEFEDLTLQDKSYFINQGWIKAITNQSSFRFININPDRIEPTLRQMLSCEIQNIKDSDFFDSNQEITPAYGLIPPGLLGHKKKRVIDNCKLIEKIASNKIDIEYKKSDKFAHSFLQKLKENLNLNRIQLNLKPLSHDDYFDHLFGKKSDIIFGSKSLDFPDPISIFSYFKYKSDSSYFFSINPEIDLVLKKAYQEVQIDNKRKIYDQMEHIILKQNTTIPVSFGTNSAGMWSEKVKSVPEHPFGIQFMLFDAIEMH